MAGFEAMPVELVVFDFDGTLAYRPGRWSQCMVEVLDEHRVGHWVTVGELRPYLRSVFPWHTPDRPHPELADPEAWWAALTARLAAAYTAVGVTVDDNLMRAVRDRYCDPAGFHLYDDTINALNLLASTGVRCRVLSNHVPELDAIVAGVGLMPFFNRVLTSARLGFEKPHPEAFRAALGDVPAARAWMIGDNPTADHEGARAVGMRSLLVRQSHTDGLLAAARTVTDA